MLYTRGKGQRGYQSYRCVCVCVYLTAASAPAATPAAASARCVATAAFCASSLMRATSASLALRRLRMSSVCWSFSLSAEFSAWPVRPAPPTPLARRAPLSQPGWWWVPPASDGCRCRASRTPHRPVR